MAGRKSIAAVIAAAVLVVPSAAAAKSKVYAGTTDGNGQIAVDVKLNKDGEPKKITEIRVNKIPVRCEQSGDITVFSTYSGSNIGIKDNGKFYGETVQPQPAPALGSSRGGLRAAAVDEDRVGVEAALDQRLDP
jgi:hypothetical protein